jgi:hypothetical protein
MRESSEEQTIMSIGGHTMLPSAFESKLVVSDSCE